MLVLESMYGEDVVLESPTAARLTLPTPQARSSSVTMILVCFSFLHEIRISMFPIFKMFWLIVSWMYIVYHAHYECSFWRVLC